MIGKRKPSTYERVLAEMKAQGIDTEGVTVTRPFGRGFEYWIVKNDRVIGEYNVTYNRLRMYELND